MATNPFPSDSADDLTVDALRSARRRCEAAIALLEQIEPAEMAESDVCHYVATASLYLAGAITNIDCAEVVR